MSSTKTKEDLLKETRDTLVATPEERQAIYDKMADSYDQDVETAEYCGPKKFYEEFCKLKIPKEARMLEIGVGTGALGTLLQKGGYCNVDGLDENAKMLEICKKKGVYKNYILSALGKGHTIPSKNDAYDALLAVGCIGPSHVEIDAFPEMIRVTKPGGKMVWFLHDMSNYKDILKESIFLDGGFDAYVQSLCDNGTWKMVQEPYILPKYYMDDKATMYTMQKL